MQTEKIKEKLLALNSWYKVLEKTSELLINMGKDNPLKKADFQLINQRVLLLRDKKTKWFRSKKLMIFLNYYPTLNY